MKTYLITETNTVHGFEVYSQHETRAAAEKALRAGESIVSVEILDISTEYVDDALDEYALVTVTANIDNEQHEATYCVHLAGGEYLPQMGYWITTSGGDYEFTDAERMIFEVAEVVRAAEKAASCL